MMPAQKTQFAQDKKFTAAGTVRAGMLIKMAATDTYGSQEYPDATECADNTENGIAIVKGEPGTSFDAGEQFSAWLLGSTIVHVKVGTGGAARGSRASQAAAGDGLTNLPAFGAGSRIHSPGVFLNTGVVNDFVALLVLPAMSSKA